MRTIDEHVRAAEELSGSVPALAQFHATLALVGAVREVGDHLDMLPRQKPRAEAAPTDDFPLHAAAALLEQAAVGDEGELREWTIAHLVLHSRSHYLNAEPIAVSAREQTDEDTPERKAVLDAIELLGIAIGE